ncbi:hypothetical protein [Couchioplanes caeruleus]|uniref:Uncharacterized protein n=2 Tax=Couchioplanes caeruleus TaxID=56438 RepID=A0A1K0GSF8_9ACTN|nr:hypothetical protein [Couchioplanes caeruleus]OJF15382.1 hypothetical protein BG844_04585 [Couchioplanes caeruleus subsp. caeruleus]ROP33421.1 hypothetical protein EDD30_6401 [Couchioplanes caeruleus]
MKVTKAQLRAAVARVAEDLITDGPSEIPSVVGLKEINRMFGYAANTAYQLRARGVLPVATSPISNNPVWKLVTIYNFAEQTNREIVWDPWGICAPSGEPEKSTDGTPEGE